MIRPDIGSLLLLMRGNKDLEWEVMTGREILDWDALKEMDEEYRKRVDENLIYIVIKEGGDDDFFSSHKSDALLKAGEREYRLYRLTEISSIPHPHLNRAIMKRLHLDYSIERKASVIFSRPIIERGVADRVLADLHLESRCTGWEADIGDSISTRFISGGLRYKARIYQRNLHEINVIISML